MKSLATRRANICTSFAFVLAVGLAVGEEPLTVTTFNIEHLGSPGRGFGGGFGTENGPLAKRTDQQLKNLAKLIKDDLKSDVLALQEIAITNRRLGKSTSTSMSKIVKELKVLGQKWDYYLPPIKHIPDPDDEHNVHLGFLWNRDRVRLLAVFEMDFENQELGGKNLFDRMPLIGYFEAIRDNGKPGNDFVLVNVHMGSGQGFDESHLIAMTLIEFELSATLGRHAVTEVDRIILGDFNDNPLEKKDDGSPQYSPALYEHMKYKGYVDLVTKDIPTTRLSAKLNSQIDHVLVNKAARKLIAQDKADIFRLDDGTNDPAKLSEWRREFSDHFPLSFKMEVTTDDDSDFFE
jgi:endonuclease/exonuclease/phosphatase family metal-dependent hydrolase